MDIALAMKYIDETAFYNPACFDFTEEEARAKNLWKSDNSMPTQAELQAASDIVSSDLAANQYKKDRELAYNSIKDQLDMQYHDLVDGTSTWKDHIDSVKTQYPKS